MPNALEILDDIDTLRTHVRRALRRANDKGQIDVSASGLAHEALIEIEQLRALDYQEKK